MKKMFSILALSLLPTIASAAGSHHGGGHGATGATDHGLPGHDMSTMPHVPAVNGQPGDPSLISRTIEVHMLDTMRFMPGEIQVDAGETVRFLVRNSGKLSHEMVIGSLADLKAHAVEMRQNPGMKHAEPNAITLDPGQQGDLVWKFEQAGTVDFACTIPGHMEGGMIGKIKVG